MSEDDDLFRRSMKELGVTSLDGARSGPRTTPSAHREVPERDERRPRSEGESAVREAADRELFLAALDADDPPPDKDAAGAPVAPLTAAPVREKAPKRPAPVDDVLDLHGERSEHAIRVLRRTLGRAVLEGLRTLLVVTGKGHHSDDGPVLRGAVERWLLSHGGEWVERYSPAPRALGGRGAWLLVLRRR